MIRKSFQKNWHFNLVAALYGKVGDQQLLGTRIKQEQIQVKSINYV